MDKTEKPIIKTACSLYPLKQTIAEETDYNQTVFQKVFYTVTRSGLNIREYTY
ncbi:MAG: hypothetical protein NC113_01975 [Bacteroides sp.]|nr:hypothetical protein [Bacteroides sp.]